MPPTPAKLLVVPASESVSAGETPAPRSEVCSASSDMRRAIAGSARVEYLPHRIANPVLVSRGPGLFATVAGLFLSTASYPLWLADGRSKLAGSIRARLGAVQRAATGERLVGVSPGDARRHPPSDGQQDARTVRRSRAMNRMEARRGSRTQHQLP